MYVVVFPRASLAALIIMKQGTETLILADFEDADDPSRKYRLDQRMYVRVGKSHELLLYPIDYQSVRRCDRN